MSISWFQYFTTVLQDVTFGKTVKSILSIQEFFILQILALCHIRCEYFHLVFHLSLLFVYGSFGSGGKKSNFVEPKVLICVFFSRILSHRKCSLIAMLKSNLLMFSSSTCTLSFPTVRYLNPFSGYSASLVSQENRREVSR